MHKTGSGGGDRKDKKGKSRQAEACYERNWPRSSFVSFNVYYFELEKISRKMKRERLREREGEKKREKRENSTPLKIY